VCARAPDLGDGDALERVDDEHARDEVARAVGQVRRQVVDAALRNNPSITPDAARMRCKIDKLITPNATRMRCCRL
jgi:hypothetical protein